MSTQLNPTQENILEALRAKILEKLADMEYQDAFEALGIDPWSVIEEKIESTDWKTLLKLI